MTARKSSTSRHVTISLLAALAAGVLLVPRDLTDPLRAQSSRSDGKPSRISPNPDRGKSSVNLSRGKHLLFSVMQHFADSVGKRVWIAGDIPIDHPLKIDQSIGKLDFQAVDLLLRRNGLLIDLEERGEEKVYWVSKRLSRQRKKGGLVRREVPPAGDPAFSPAAGGIGTAPPVMDSTGHVSVRTFQRVDGSERTYLVTVEVRTRDEAEQVARTIALILANREKKSGGK